MIVSVNTTVSVNTQKVINQTETIHANVCAQHASKLLTDHSVCVTFD
jgi:hypothetical protein